jgi:hypothetical protein
VAAGSDPLPRARVSIRRLTAAALLALAGCADRQESAADAEADLGQSRVALGGGFVGGRAAGLRELLHRDLIVQPPAPDSALQGAAAADYLERLARGSDVERSELLPRSISREGGFLLERGSWIVETGARRLASRYMLRWRDSPTGWSVVLWRWTPFREQVR